VQCKFATFRRTFNQRAELYHRVRPDYPDLLFDDLFELAELKSGVRVLEVGCGTGKRPDHWRGEAARSFA